MKVKGSEVILEATGRRLYAYGGVIGLGPQYGNPNVVVAHYGYDGELTEYEKPLTVEERRELAEYMVTRWKDFGGL